MSAYRCNAARVNFVVHLIVHFVVCSGLKEKDDKVND